MRVSCLEEPLGYGCHAYECHRFCSGDDERSPEVKFVEPLQLGLEVYELLASGPQPYGTLKRKFRVAQWVLLFRLMSAEMLTLEEPRPGVD